MKTVGETSHTRSSRPRPWLSARGIVLPALLAAALFAAASSAVAPALGAAAPSPPVPQAPSSIIIDRVSGHVLYGRGMHQERPMASTTKIMTALVVLARSPALGRTIVAPARVVNESGIGLRPGERITVRQALLALMIRSAQDAGVTLATAVAGSEQAFVGLMNAKARTLGLHDTHYTNACGNIPDRDHHSSVHDLAKLARRAMADARFRDLVRRQRSVIRWGAGRQLAVRSNNLLLHFAWADGVKSGFTGTARFCLVGSGRPGLRPFITATLKARNRERDARDHVALFTWASSLYERKTVVGAGDEVAVVPLEGGGEVHVAARTALTAVVRSAAPVRSALTLPARFAERPADGAVAGSVLYRADGVRLGSVELVVFTPAPPVEPAAASADAAVL